MKLPKFGLKEGLLGGSRCFKHMFHPFWNGMKNNANTFRLLLVLRKLPTTDAFGMGLTVESRFLRARGFFSEGWFLM